MLSIKDGAFYLNQEKFHIYSGAIHYFRVLPEYWEDRLLKLKAAGFNTVETYVCWNLHEPQKGHFDFSGRLDLVRFLKTAQKVGLHAIVRPGPYICAEWDFGGFPAWLLKDKNMRLRCNDPTYMGHVTDFFHELLARLAPLQITKGGNIIAMQVENEYGSFGNDKAYLNALKALIQSCGIDVLLFTSDGTNSSMLSGGTLPDVYKTLNFGSGADHAFQSLKRFPEHAPKMCMEFWCGWFDHWGDKHHTRDAKSIVKEIKNFIAQDASFNVYMFHGGTNFGFTAGANHYRRYSPTVTSYDYCALLNEYGDYTPQYHAVREILCKHQGLPMEQLPPPPQLQSIGEVAFTQKAGLFENLNQIGQTHYSSMPESMEYYGQNFGLIYYQTKLHGEYGMGTLTLKDLHDRAYVYIDKKLKKIVDTSKQESLFKKIKKKDGLIVNFNKEETEIGILVDAMGRVNYGEHLTDRKGISALNLNLQTLMDFQVTTIPLEHLDQLDYTQYSETYPMFFKGYFKTMSQADCFVELTHFTKGVVFVNGFNLGRYWNRGPQKTLYLPGALLKEENEIIVLELEHCSQETVTITDQHKL